MKPICVIPARYASTRFPGKPLALLSGCPVIAHVYRQAKKAIDDVFVATDDTRIYNTVKAFGGEAVMTRSDHKSGTDRVEEALEKINDTINDDSDDVIVVNVQGDEPFIQPSHIEALYQCFGNPVTDIATIGTPFNNSAALQNTNSPKIVIDNKGYALYFSRGVIPFIRGKEPTEWLSYYPYLKHIGIYAYRREVLHKITRLATSSLEQAESLEQLRWLQNGFKIKVIVTDTETMGIDTPADLRRAEQWLTRHPH